MMSDFSSETMVSKQWNNTFKVVESMLWWVEDGHVLYHPTQGKTESISILLETVLALRLLTSAYSGVLNTIQTQKIISPALPAF